MTTTLSTGPAPADMTAMREAMASGRVTASALVDQAIERAEAVNPQLNFIAWPTFERARGQAEEPRSGPLAGVPTLIKDMLPEKGIPASFGSAALRDFIPPDDAPYARAITNSGLISIARSAMPELGLNAVTESPLLGPTRNPWNLDHTPGGSSGGGAAAVAAGVVPVAHASDGLGSIRHGAAPCGLVGLKPTRGRLAQDRMMREMPVRIVSDGVLTRSVRDTAAFYREAEKVWRNPLLAPVGGVTRPGRARLRIAVVTDGIGRACSPEVRELTLRTAALLERLGHRVEEIDNPVPESFPEHFVRFWSMLALVISRRASRARG